MPQPLADLKANKALLQPISRKLPDTVSVATTSSGHRALVLGDEPSLLRAINVILDRGGFEVLVVESAAELVAAVEQRRPVVVVVDVALTGAQGLRLLPAILDSAPRCAVVVLSPFEALRGPALQLGARAVVAVSDLRPLKRCLEHLGDAAQSSCECCAPAGDGTISSIAPDPRPVWITGNPASRGPWSRYYDPTSEAPSTASSDGSHKTNPPPS